MNDGFISGIRRQLLKRTGDGAMKLSWTVVKAFVDLANVYLGGF